MRAIVVDDSRAMRSILKKQLEGAGLEVLEAGHGREALERLKAVSGVGLALVDWNMPEMNGLELVAELRANARFSAMRVLMVTSESELSSVERALSAGANDYLMKPFTPDALREKLGVLGVLK